MNSKSDTKVMLNHYTKLMARWSWLILLTAIVMGASSYYIRQLLPPSYTAKSIVIIGNYITEPNPGEREIQTQNELALTYVVIARTDTVLQGAMDILEMNNMSMKDFREMVSVSLVEETGLIEISATSEMPAEAASIANAISEQLLLNSPTFLTDEQAEQLETTQEQVDSLDTRLEQIQTELDEVDAQLTSTDDSEEISRLTARHDVLIDQIGIISTNINEANEIVLELQRRINTLEIFEFATPPVEEDGINPIIIGIFGAIVGIIFGVGGILLLDYFDNTITSASDVDRLVQLPVLGSVKMGQKELPLVTNDKIANSILEDYRTIQARMNYSFAKNNVPTYLVTSLNDSENKSLTTANLAYTLSQAGKRVLLVDADFRNPKLHKIFNIKNDKGLTDLLKSVTEGNRIVKDKSVDELTKLDTLASAMHDIEGENLSVIPTSEYSNERNTLIMLDAIGVWHAAFKEMDFDIVIFDAPASLDVSDSTIIASHVNSEVLLVVEARQTTSDKILQVQEKFSMVGHDIDSIIINRVN